MPTRLTLRMELLAMREEDLTVRERLLQAGQLEGGYHPEMEAVHTRNAARMREILSQHGWPTRTLVGVDGEEAAWMVVMHAIGDPDLLRKSLAVLENAVSAGEAPAWQFACLADRIAFFEGRPQRYGTQLDWDDEGYNSVYRLEDSEHVNEFRATVGLGPLERIGRDGQTVKDPESLRRDRERYEAWARKVGWRK